MTIDIQRECGGGVTQIALKGLDVVAVSDRDDSILVSEIMKAESRTAHAFDDAFEAIVDCAVGQDNALLVREDKVMCLSIALSIPQTAEF